MKNAISYTAHAVEIDGLTDSVRYTLREGKVIAHLMTADCDIELAPGDEGYAEALQAAGARERKPAKERNSEPAPVKWWLGQEIKGKGWKIVADGAYDRIRVIFQRVPSEAAKEAVKAAGFYYSPQLKSWNRGLKCKAWRAAELLAVELKNLDNPEAARRAQARREYARAEREAAQANAAEPVEAKANAAA